MNKKRLLVGLCSWSNPNLLKSCIISLMVSMDLSKDGIAVVLNQADVESQDFLHLHGIPFVSLPENRGVLAIDYLKPFIENSEYFLNTNDDMLFHKGFADDLIETIEKYYPASASCRLIENFHSGNPCVVVDTDLQDINSPETFTTFIRHFEEGRYKVPSKIISYCHPICVKSSDFLKIGGYSGNWDMDFFSGYGRDDMFAYNLWNLYGGNFSHVCSDKSFVFHASSATMRRLPPEIKNQHNMDTFQRKSGRSIHQFRQEIGLGNNV